MSTVNLANRSLSLSRVWSESAISDGGNLDLRRLDFGYLRPTAESARAAISRALVGASRAGRGSPGDPGGVGSKCDASGVHLCSERRGNSRDAKIWTAIAPLCGEQLRLDEDLATDNLSGMDGNRPDTLSISLFLSASLSLIRHWPFGLFCLICTRPRLLFVLSHADQPMLMSVNRNICSSAYENVK